MTEPTDAELQQLWQNSNPTNFEAISFARAVLQRWGQPSGAGNHPYAIQWDAELGRTAMRFVDRAGDVHPGIDDAETICAEFHAAMSAVIERMPHVQRMSTTPQSSPQAGAVPLTVDEVEQLIAQWSYELHGDRARYLVRMTEQHHGIKGGQHGTE